MNKKNNEVEIVKLQVMAGKANPAPPVGTALGPKGIQIMAFCKEFNERTKDKGNFKIPTVITIAKDKSFTFTIKEPTTAALIKDAINLPKGSTAPGLSIVANITKAKIKEIAERKMPDFNCFDLKAACSMVEGTARAIGIEVVES